MNLELRNPTEISHLHDYRVHSPLKMWVYAEMATANVLLPSSNC